MSTRVIGEDGQGLLHLADLTGLRPATTYRYAIADASGKTEGAFQTAPARGSTQPLRFIIYGDTRTDPNAHRAVMKSMKADMPVAFLVNSGDFVANGEVWPLWKKEFFDPAADILRQIPLWPVRGNHEQDSVHYLQIFDPPGAGLYYSFDSGDLHVTVLDTGLVDNAPPDANMVAWLEKDLAATKAPWKIVSLHQPFFNLGGHASHWGQKDVLPLLEKYGVDMVVSGHSHMYERFVPIGPSGGKPILHITAGGGGAPLYDLRPSPLLDASHLVYHYCLFEIQGDRLQMTVKTPDGNTLDSLVLVKKDGKYQPEIMKRAWDTQEAIDVTFIISGFSADVAEMPQAGKPVTLTLSSRAFPKGTQVKLGQPADGNWTIIPTEFQMGDTRPTFEAIPPEGVKFVQRNFNIGVKVALTATYHGKTYTRDDVPVSLIGETIQRFTPEPAPVDVPMAAAPFSVDGNLSDWAGVPGLAVGRSRSPSKMVRLAWRPEGLYGAVMVPDSNVRANLKKPWNGDCFELFVEADYGRALGVGRNPNVFKVEIVPRPDRPGAAATVHGGWGRFMDDANVIQAAWQRTPDGYTMEFLVPVSALAPAKMEPGTKIGFHYALRDDGHAMEMFKNPPKNMGGFGTTPLYWGALRLAGTP
jgi:hypothetical protein